MLFVHIPKTAGTSMRLALSRVYGAEACCFDYGVTERQTSALVRDWVYERKDIFGFSQHFDANADDRLLCGHFGVAKYLPLVDPRRIMTFVRHPHQQVMSHYRHFQRHRDYQGSFESFVKTASFQNIQSQYLKGLPLPAVGFLGVVEKMEASLKLLGAGNGLVLQMPRANGDPDKSEDAYALTDEQKKLVTECNRQDMQMYRRAVMLFNERERVATQGRRLALGQASISDKGRLTGWAFWLRSDAEVAIEVRVKEGVSRDARASLPSAFISSSAIPRKGFAGFDLPVPDAALRSGKGFQVLVSETGQVLASFGVKDGKWINQGVVV